MIVTSLMKLIVIEWLFGQYFITEKVVDVLLVFLFPIVNEISIWTGPGFLQSYLTFNVVGAWLNFFTLNISPPNFTLHFFGKWELACGYSSISTSPSVPA